MQTLFDSLDKTDQSRILTNKRVIDIKSDTSGVEAVCGDGSIHHGSIIIGADGVHSEVRQAMRRLALGSSKANTNNDTSDDINDEKPFTSTYKAMWFPFPRQSQFTPGDVFESHGTNISTQLLNGDKDSWVFVYEKLETPTKERISYSDDDVMEMANRWGDLSLSPNLKIKDIFPKRYTAGMANLEEGVVKYWSWDNIVLVGDACHKFTPNQALGFNNGVQDVVSLVNELHKGLAAKEGNLLDATSIAIIFAKYQASRMKLAEKDHDMSASVTRMTTWNNWLNWLLDRYILSSIPGFDDFMVTKVMAGPISRSFVLNFVKADESYQGKVPWKHVMTSSGMDVGGP
jgi:2-polyprenyl-6-methoxyphenol hydroxylase-like FAD-dependent oxidoreductase